ncbi:acyl-CoA thioesterase [Acidimangrovimonas sediminis]|uniref:acyl-CoA thioesterase n=1 Tax=Acidimangrovimonas sediminis TaxID=2056283 RepID=UPI000C80C2E1|nr:acyl-CoA thioesterase II [Acidimangrovimonas sediminis]
MDPIDTLLDLLNIEPLEINLFRGRGSGGETSKRIFGGQVISQALAAAYHTVEDRACHSLHAYFIRPGDPEIPVIYEVDRARDGGSFTTRRVIAIQHGRQIFNLAASFHIEEESPLHQHPMPESLPDPETLPSRAETRAKLAESLKSDYARKRRDDFLRDSPIEMREVEPYDLANPVAASDRHSVWFRLARPVGGPGWLQHCLLAYASDLHLLGSSLRPLGESWLSGTVMTASLDHALWFHHPVNFDDWHLYVMDAPFIGGARGFNRGSIYSRDGVLVASVAQEGLIRPIVPR